MVVRRRTLVIGLRSKVEGRRSKVEGRRSSTVGYGGTVIRKKTSNDYFNCA
jgi:hypothetical protein